MAKRLTKKTKERSTSYVSPAECSACTGKPHVDAKGNAMFCEDCSRRAHAKPERYDIGRGGPPERTSPL